MAVDGLPTDVILVPPSFRDRVLPSLPAYIPPLDTGQPNATDLNDLGSKPRATFAAGNSIIPITYGRDRLFGKPFVVSVCNTKGCLYIANSFCEGEINGYEQIIVDSKDIIAEGTGYFGLKNRGFESGAYDHWNTGGTAISNTESNSGGWSGKVASLAGGPNLISEFTTAPAVGSVLRIRGFMLRDPLALPDANASIAMRWYDAAFAAVGGRDTGTPQAGVTPTADFTVAGWQALETDVTVPATAVYYSFDFGESAGTTGEWYCDDAETVLLDVEGNESTIEVVLYTGDPAQIADSMLVGRLMGYVDTAPNLAYMVTRVPAKATTGFPRIEAVIQGRKVYDPRLDTTRTDITPVGSGAHRENTPATWAYSANPAICFRDVIANFTGMGMADQGVVDLAAYNDELISSVPRREIGLTLAQANEVDHWIAGFRTYMGGFLGWENGLLRVVPNKPDVEAPGAALFDNTASTWIDMGDQVALDVGLGSFTLEAAFSAPTSTVTNKAIAGKILSETVLGAGYVIYMDTVGSIRARVDDGTNAVNIVSTAQYDDGMYHHAAMVVNRTANTMDLIIDDVVAATQVSIAAVTLTLSNAEPFRVGALGNTGGLFDGKVDEVRLWNDVRTPTELANNRVHEITDPTLDASLVGYWRMNDATSSTTAIDSSVSANNGTVSGAADFTFGNPQIIPVGVAMHIGVDDIVKDSLNITRRTLRSVPNSVAVDYEDSSGAKWITSRVQADSARVTGNLEQRRLSRVSLPGIHNASQAAREATQRLNWYLTDLEATLSLFDEGWQLQHGSIVAVTHPIGLDAKLFRVRGSNAKSGRWTMDLVEYDPAVYSNEVIADPTIPDTNLGDPLNPPTVTGLTVVEELFNYKNGNTGSRVRISWNATSFPFLSQYLVEGYVDGSKVWQTFTGATNVATPGVEELVTSVAVEYEVRVYAQSPFAQGVPAINTVDILGKLAAPSDVPSITATQISANQVFVKWNEATDIDIWRYELRRGSTSDTWATATDLGPARNVLIDGLEITRTNIPLGTYRFFVKAIDSVGNESVNAATDDVTLSAPPSVAVLNGFEVASEVRLNWPAPATGFVARYRVAYSDIPQTFETTLDVVDTLRFQTKDVPEGSFTFKVYSQDSAGNETATPATRVIEVTSDADAFLADSYDFVTPGLTNMVEYFLRVDTRQFYVTNMADTFAVTPTDFIAAVPLANYHTAGASEWLSEVKDFLIPLTGSWNLTQDVVALAGVFDVALELSTDNIAYTVFGTSAKGEFRYARVRISTAASPGTATAFVKSPVMNLKVNVVPLEESGSATSVTSGGKVINLSREYTAVKEINAQPKNNADALMAIVDNIVVGPNTAVQGDGTNYLDGGDIAAFNFGATADFSWEFYTKHPGGTALALLVGKGGSAGAGWQCLMNRTSGNIRIILKDGVNTVDVTGTSNSITDDGSHHHIAISVDRTGDLLRLYVDDVEDASSPFTTVALTGSLASASAFRTHANDAGTEIFNGPIDELRVWNDIRTAGEFSANRIIALDMTQTQPGLIGYWLMDGPVGGLVTTIADVSIVATNTLTDTGAGDLTYIDPGSAGNLIQKINSFDVYVFDIFGQQLAEQFQWNIKMV